MRGRGRRQEDDVTMIHPDHPIETAVEALQQLEELRVERAIAQPAGLLGDATYVADLEADIAATQHAFVGLVVTEIATLRGELGTRLQG
jgi:hypothetical protein